MNENEKNTQTAENNQTPPADEQKAEKPVEVQKSDNSPSDEELAEFQKWKELQQSEAEKTAAAIAKAEKARIASDERAAAAELKLTALSKGITADALDDVIALAKTKITDKVTAEQAIEDIIKKYPAFTSKADLDTGTRTTNNKLEADETALRKAMGLPSVTRTDSL